MKTIIYIRFPSSKKDYAYLLDEGADKVPSPGDTLVFCRGASRCGAMTTNIQVTCLKQVMFTPDIVTSGLHISDGRAYSFALPIEYKKISDEPPAPVPIKIGGEEAKKPSPLCTYDALSIITKPAWLKRFPK